MEWYKLQSITLEEFLKRPETKPASEYIDGQIIQKPMPQGKHSTIQTEFSTVVRLTLYFIASPLRLLDSTYSAGFTSLSAQVN
ncbi:MAG: Uma2 family endonuclease [Coleofasciculus sp. C3-bin4]|nr:Uma2 family endonuclease [Coleofasciculus sp. C3-bin4]